LDFSELFDDGSTGLSLLQDSSDLGGVPSIPTYSGENKWLKTGSDLFNTGVDAAAAFESGGLDIGADIGLVVDIVKDVGNIFDDIASFFGGDDESEDSEKGEN